MREDPLLANTFRGVNDLSTQVADSLAQAMDRGGSGEWSLPTTAACSVTLRAGAIHAIRLNDIDPQAWLADVLERIADPSSASPQLLPWHWRPASAALSRNAA